MDDVIALEFIGLLAILTGAAALLSFGAEALAERYGANFTGSIVLAVITTMPEYMFVIWACIKGHYDMAVGSAVGACTLLITLGYGSIILFATTRISRKPVKAIELSKATKVDALYLLVTALAAFGLAWEGNGFDAKDAAILILLFFAYIVHVAKGAVKFARENSVPSHSRTGLPKSIGFLLGGGVVIFFCSGPFVDSMIKVAGALGISPVTVAIILGPLASEIPEKITAYITVIRNGKLAEISVCNFIGSKVNHNSLLLGTIPLIALLQGGDHQPAVHHYDGANRGGDLEPLAAQAGAVGGRRLHAPVCVGDMGSIPPGHRKPPPWTRLGEACYSMPRSSRSSSR
jgi:cation:H+ antiporter